MHGKEIYTGRIHKKSTVWWRVWMETELIKSPNHRYARVCETNGNSEPLYQVYQPQLYAAQPQL